MISVSTEVDEKDMLKARGIRLPDGTIHDGYFIVRDTGGAFHGIGTLMIDLFTGTGFQKSRFSSQKANGRVLGQWRFC